VKAIIDEILKATKSQEWRDKATSLLVEICKIDTTPASDVTIMRDAEAKVFDILERELAKVKLGKTRCERRKIDPAIAKHPAYSQLHFTKTEDCPEGLSPEEVYAERVNLLFFADGKKGRGNGVAVNSHIDVVKPYFPPRVEDGIVFGRGSCDDKGSVVSTIVALRILGDVLSRFGKSLSRDVIGMFVVEEETGGNGSLSLALDKSLSDLYSSLLVLECCGNDIHPANRGAVWYPGSLGGA
jgi:acetylornithine deacetylase/succinyl-diaminopimelate desuccinylase-like protein